MEGTCPFQKEVRCNANCALYVEFTRKCSIRTLAESSYKLHQISEEIKKLASK